MKIIILHFHKRRTGVTTSVEELYESIKQKEETYMLGYGTEKKSISIWNLIIIIITSKKIILHANRNIEAIFALSIKKINKNVNYIYTRHSSTIPSKLTEYLLKKADRCIYLTPDNNINNLENSIYLKQGVNLNRFTSVNKSEELITNIGIVGRIRPKKGQLVAIMALIPLLKSKKEWKLKIIGKVDNPEYIKELKRIIKINNIENQIEFLDETKNIEHFYSTCSIIITPSSSEGFSLVPLEAIASGCTVFATKNVGIHSYLFDHTINGYLFEVGNYKELSLQIENVINNNYYINRKILNNTIRNWSWSNLSNDYLKVYEDSFK
jgi:mannosyltransferase